ncbi:MAG TPA: glycosyltransferase [Bryobacteraceae bacterium]|jgi:spore maturation protein CgeB|nr:glycosyltransferase [Bryobacteraceae bacterium]
MRFIIFTHSLVSDWNHGNAHFQRGIASELVRRGHEVRILEPAGGWSREHLISEYGEQAISDFAAAYPLIRSELYREDQLDLDTVLQAADIVLVHEWNTHALVARIGQYRAMHPPLRAYFHDTHHRAATDPASMSGYDLRHYDGVFAYGKVIADLYRANGWAEAVWVWHEAADTAVFHPIRNGATREGDLVWIGNWGDNERTQELREFLIAPVRALGLRARVYGVRYPAYALDELRSAGIEYGGWLPNYKAPEVFARYRVTVHIPRRPYSRALPGIPTIRPFEAMACGIPLISAPWQDTENLFHAGRDYLLAQDGAEMTTHLRRVLGNPEAARELSRRGMETIEARHTCAHRVDELLEIVGAQRQGVSARGAA